ncbi:MAG: cytochrome P450, partial [Acidimicrobiales bacterium]
MDTTVWDDPHRLDIERGPAGATQMTLGWGIHHCLGAALARAELQEALPLLARSMPDVAIDGEIEWKAANIGIWGPARLPLRFTPAADG